jgi:hypothetical protein
LGSSAANAGRDHRHGTALTYELGAHGERRVTLLSKHADGRIIVFNNIGSIHQLQPLGNGSETADLPSKLANRAHQYDRDLVLANRVQSRLHRNLRGTIAPHRVNGNRSSFHDGS